jgi:hypothetical protein
MKTFAKKPRVNMEFTKKRKIMILAGMFALLAVTGFLNFTVNNDNSVLVGGGLNTGNNNQHFYSSANLFNMFRTTRAAEREASVAVLRNISTAESGFSAQAKADAEAQLLTLLRNIEFENTCEHLIIAAGFSDVVVSKTNGNVNVLVKNSQQLTDAEAARILQILRSVQPGLLPRNVFVSVIE